MNGLIFKSQNSPFEWLKHVLLFCSIMQGQNNFQVHWGVLDETTYPCSLLLGTFGHVGFIHGWLSSFLISDIETVQK